MILFGYQSDTQSMYLYEDGSLAWGSSSGGQAAVFCVPEESMMRIRGILRENREMLRQCGERINGRSDTEDENCFILEDLRIIDWDLTRWYVEEDRSRHPDYYENTVKVELTETYVRGVFDEICEILAGEDKRLLYGRTIL